MQIILFIADENTVAEIKYAVEDTVTIPNVPQKTGYTGEWVGLPVSGGDVTVTAKYSPINYTITYQAEGTVIKILEYNVENLEEITPPVVPEKYGYSAKWEEKVFDSGNITINAIYSIQVYTATFIADGKVIVTSKFQIDNMQITEPEIPQKDGYSAKWKDYALKCEAVS